MKVALVGKMRSGKDTIAEYAEEKYDFTRFAFGDGIREVARMLFPDQMKNGNKPRSLLQGIGQTMRQFDNNVWVNKCFNIINGEIDFHGIFNDGFRPIITDLRQPNEFAKCKEEGFITIKVHCDDEIRIKRILEKNDNFDKKDLEHETEMHIDAYNCDFIIHNNGSLEDLYRQFDNIVREINLNEKVN